MKHSIIKKRFAFITGISSIFFCSIVNAQIVYTNIQDVTFKCNKKCSNCYNYFDRKTYPLDLNNDGSADFNITAYRAVSHADGCQGYYCCLDVIYNRVSITALNDNSVIIGPSGTALIYSSDISSLSEWSTGNFSLKSVSEGYGYYCEILKEGNWPNSSDRYLGLRITSNGQSYYGWVRLSVFVDISETSLTIKDYAYESTPGKAIHAGDTKAPLANSSVSNASKKDAASLNVMIVPNPVASSATISFSLDKTENASIKIFDVNGRLVKSLADAEFIVGTHQLKWDATNIGSGIYVVKMRAGNYIETKKLVVIK